MPICERPASLTAFGNGRQKLGQPVPLSNFAFDEKRSRSQPAQANVPLRFSRSSGLVKERSVPCSRRTWNCSGVSSARHSASLCVTSNDAGEEAFAGVPKRVTTNNPAVDRPPTIPSSSRRFPILATRVASSLIEVDLRSKAATHSDRVASKRLSHPLRNRPRPPTPVTLQIAGWLPRGLRIARPLSEEKPSPWRFFSGTSLALYPRGARMRLFTACLFTPRLRPGLSQVATHRNPALLRRSPCSSSAKRCKRFPRAKACP